GAIMNLTRERIRQVEVKALAKLEALRDMSFLRDFVDEGPVGKRRLPQLSKADKVGTKYDDDAEVEEDEIDSVELEEAELEKKHRGPVAVLEI
ncbi:MAG: hypothetical protein ABJB12_23540, partial [Pseudomonadota bacterium]